MLSANAGAAAKRKPLSLKLERKNSPKKAALKTAYAWDKENQHMNAVVQPTSEGKLKSKVQATVSQADESEERMALRRRVEEAVATHLAQRSTAPMQEQVETKEMDSDEICLGSHLKAVEVDSLDLSSGSSKGINVFTIVAMLLVTSMAIWSGVRVALLKPDAAIALYQPYAAAIAGIVPNDLLLRATQPMQTFQRFVTIDLREEVTEGIGMSVIDAYEYIYVDEMARVEDVVENGNEGAEAEMEPQETVEDMLADVPKAPEATETVEHHETALSNSVDVNQATEMVPANAPPGYSRTQVILRKAFDVLTPLKRVLAKVQDKIGLWVRNVRTFFAKRN